jgi:hypothetical protein
MTSIDRSGEAVTSRQPDDDWWAGTTVHASTGDEDGQPPLASRCGRGASLSDSLMSDSIVSDSPSTVQTTPVSCWIHAMTD